MRSKREIDKQMEQGRIFVKTYPFSIFGTDNTRLFNIFQKIVEKVWGGMTNLQLEEFIDIYNDEDNSFAHAVIEWLFDNGEEVW